MQVFYDDRSLMIFRGGKGCNRWLDNKAILHFLFPLYLDDVVFFSIYSHLP